MMSKIIENNLRLPFIAIRQGSYFSDKRLRHGIDSRKQYSVDCTGSSHIIVCSMRRNGSTKRLHQIYQTMGFQPRESNSRQIKRIDPDIVEKRITRWMARGERSVKPYIMGNHFRIADKFHQSLEGIIRTWSVLNILIVYVRQMRNFIGNFFSRIYECDIPINDFPFFHPRSRYLS